MEKTTIVCQFCNKKIEDIFEKTAISLMHHHIEENHLEESFIYIMKEDSDYVKKTILDKYVWQFNYFLDDMVFEEGVK
jgi:hypothetical protein